jgi:pimeloyl-ACP methyl ester carboxylesterase
MIGRRSSRVALLACLAATCRGCGLLPIVNIAAGPASSVVYQEDGRARFAFEEGLEDGVWLEVDRVGEPGAVGGYLSQNANERGALIILLHGASTYDPEGTYGKARDFHREYAPDLWPFGYLTWSLAVRECGAAYGQGDLADVLEAIDWLDAEGKALLGVERVFVIGYSTGATVSTLVARHRQVDGVASMGGLAEPDQLEELWSLYDLLRRLFPQNVAMCQLGSTLDYYGPPGSPTWEALDTVARVDGLKSPALLVHAELDQVFFVDNTIHLQEQYEARLREGALLPEVEFFYVPGASHFDPPSSEEVLMRILDFFARIEAAAN